MKKDFQEPAMETREGQDWKLWQDDGFEVLWSLPDEDIQPGGGVLPGAVRRWKAFLKPCFPARMFEGRTMCSSSRS